MANVEEALARLTAIQGQLTEIGSETDALLALIEELRNAAQGNVPDEVMAKIDEVAAQAQVVADKVPNEPPPPPEP